MQLIARIVIPESWECEEIAHDNGMARIEIVGKDNDWLREILMFKTRPAEDLHITIDPDPSRPTDWKNRWGGKVETITDVETKGKPTVTTITAVSNRIHLRHILLASMPITPHAVQIPKMFLWGGPCVTACATATFVNLFRIYTLNGWWPLPRNLFAPETWLQNALPLDWPVQVMPVNPLLDQSRWITIGARWQDAETVLKPAMKDAGVVCHAYTWLPGDPAPYEVYGRFKEDLKPTRACTILSFEDQSGVGGPTGTAIDGLVNLFAVTLDDLFTETLIAVDGDGDGQTDPFIRKLLGVAPKRPPFVYRDTGYGGVLGRTTVVHKSKAITIVVGGRSPGWVWPLSGDREGPGPAMLSQSSNILRNPLRPKPDRGCHHQHTRRTRAGLRFRRSRQPLPGPARRHPARLHALRRPKTVGSRRTVRPQRALRARLRLHHLQHHVGPPRLVGNPAVYVDEVRHRRQSLPHRRGHLARLARLSRAQGDRLHRPDHGHQAAR
jgi:hypothetical protein